jgi:predicted transcriptional regulator
MSLVNKIESRRPYPRIRPNNRHKTRIIYDALTFLADQKGGSAGRTKIMYGSFLSTSQMKYYIPMLTSAKLIHYDPVTKQYVITRKGVDYIQRYTTLENLMIKS